MNYLSSKQRNKLQHSLNGNGFWANLWDGVKSVAGKVYDGVRSVGNTISNVYDKVKTYLPAPIRAIGDTVQNTYNQARSVGDVVRSNPLGLKDGGPVLKIKDRMMPPPFISPIRDRVMLESEKKFYQA